MVYQDHKEGQENLGSLDCQVLMGRSGHKANLGSGAHQGRQAPRDRRDSLVTLVCRDPQGHRDHVVFKVNKVLKDL